MKLILHDLPEEELRKQLGSLGSDEYTVVSPADNMPRRCMGCFNCWVKTPGVCIMKDGFENMATLLSSCDEMIIISRCRYGEFSLPVRILIDRCLPYCYPYFTKRKGMMHHKMRYTNHPVITAYFYGEDILDEEKELARHRVVAMGINLDSSKDQIEFFPSETVLGGVRTW